MCPRKSNPVGARDGEWPQVFSVAAGMANHPGLKKRVWGIYHVTEKHDALIGADIISQLNLAITYFSENTTLLIKFPSFEESDYPKQHGSLNTSFDAIGRRISPRLYNKPHQKLVNFETAWASPREDVVSKAQQRTPVDGGPRPDRTVPRHR